MSDDIETIVFWGVCIGDDEEGLNKPEYNIFNDKYGDFDGFSVEGILGKELSKKIDAHTTVIPDYGKYYLYYKPSYMREYYEDIILDPETLINSKFDAIAAFKEFEEKTGIKIDDEIEFHVTVSHW